MVLGIATGAAAIGSRALTAGLATRSWGIFNPDTFDRVFGTYEAENITRQVGANYAEGFSLNRENPVTMYLNSRTSLLSFKATLFNDSILGAAGIFGALRSAAAAVVEGGFPSGAKAKLDKLEEWTRRRTRGRFRPPVVVFSAGNGDIFQKSVIDSLADISYGPLGAFGEPKLITLTIQLRAYVEFDISVVTDQGAVLPESRYHHIKRATTTTIGDETRDGENMEMLAYREYGRPLMGDLIRKRHPTIQIPTIGDIVKLPSFEAIADTPIVPTSLQFETFTGARTTPQTLLRDAVFARTNRTRESIIVPAGI